MKRKGCLFVLLIPLGFVVLLTSDLSFLDGVFPSRAKRALPKSATQVQEYYRDYGFTGDFVRLLKTKMSKTEFAGYAEELGFTEKYDKTVHGENFRGITRGIGEAPSWWDEPEEKQECYFIYTEGDEYISRVTWKDGHVWFIALAW